MMFNAQNLIKKITELAKKIGRDINLMEVCGTHTQAVARHGIKQLMPKNVKLTTGPGCPVCVTSQDDIDAIVNLALSGIPVATYGDMLRVPGYYGSLEEARSNGVRLRQGCGGQAKVFSVYSVEDALELQKEHKDLVFFGLGFETTAPMTAYAIKKGLTVYSTHKLFLPAMRALLSLGEIKIDGFISPGHVSTIIGVEPYKDMNVSQVIAGFTAEDVLVAIYMLLKQIKEGRAEVENEYLRSVKEKGNREAMKAIFEVFEVTDGPKARQAGYGASNWRGFGVIPKSGLEIKNKYKKFDAKIKYKNIINQSKVKSRKSKVGNVCRCGEIIRGLKSPKECPMFKKACAPERPFGPCMVSQEGACNVEFRYG